MPERRGFTIVEMVAALFVLGIAMALTARMLTVTGRQREALEQQRIALVEVGNLMESVAAHEWETIQSKLGQSLALSPSAAEILPSAQLDVEVRPVSDPTAKHVTIRLSWCDRTGQRLPPVRLSAWIYPAEPGRGR